MSGVRYLTIAQRKEVILAILKGEEVRAFDRHKVSDLDRAALRAAADRMVDAAARSTSPIKRYYGLRRRTPLRMGYTLSLVTALVPLATAAFIAYRYRLTEVSSYPLIGAMATLFGVFSAAAGWGIASWTAHRNARTQHTINYLAARFSNKMFSENADIFNSFFVGKRIDAELINSLATSADEGAREALQALRYLLNWYEFIAVGVKQGDLDYGTVYETVGSSLAFYCDRCITYISEVRERQPKILENLVDLRLAFREH